MNVRWLPLGRGVSIAVSKQHGFGTDAVLLAYFSRPASRAERVCDLGTGCGILPFLWLRDNLAEQITGVELQKEAVLLAETTAERNGFSDRVQFSCADLRDWAPTRQGQFDRVTCNPPYFRPQSGRLPRSDAAKTARQELMCDLNDVFRAASLLLCGSGCFCCCHRPSERERLLSAGRAHGFAPVRLITVRQRETTRPFLLLAEMHPVKAHISPGFEEEWVLETDGAPSALYREIYPLCEEETL